MQSANASGSSGGSRSKRTQSGRSGLSSLGCGMDTRAFRLHPPATVEWFDVDQPGVIELRRKLYDERYGYHMIGSSVTDAGWLDRIPTCRPTLVVAEGLVMYLTERQVRELFQRLTDGFPAVRCCSTRCRRWVRDCRRCF